MMKRCIQNNGRMGTFRDNIYNNSSSKLNLKIKNFYQSIKKKKKRETYWKKEYFNSKKVQVYG